MYLSCSDNNNSACDVSYDRRSLFPFRKRSLPLLTVDAIIGNQAFTRADVIMCSGLCYNKAVCNFLNRLRKGDV